MNKFRFGIISIALFFFFISLSIFFAFNSNCDAESTNSVLANSYLEKYDISNVPFDELMSKLDVINSNVINNRITLNINNKYYDYSLNEMGISLNTESLYKTIISNKTNLNINIYNFKYKVDYEGLKEFLVNLKTTVDLEPTKGNLEMGEDHILRYVNEQVGYSLDVDKSFEILSNEFSNSVYSPKIDLVGEEVYTDDPLRLVNTKISSFTTTFDTSVKRKYNLYAAANYTTGSILMPGEVFSYWEKAGPFNKKGYVAYLGVLGNGVCQVASTIYDAELLAGLQTITRYEHPDMVPYVKGGLDATVSSSPTFVADFKFKNNLDAPIYLSVYAEDNKIIAEIWSYENATNGLTYDLESIRRGFGSYDAYRHAYNENGELVRTDYLGHSHYYTDI